MPRIDDLHARVVRTANDAVRALATEEDPRSFLCECGDPDCSRGILLTAPEYDGLRDGIDPRVVHPVCAAREERFAVVAENRQLRQAMAEKLARLLAGAERLRRNRGDA